MPFFFGGGWLKNIYRKQNMRSSQKKMRDLLFSMERSKYGRPRPSRRRTAPGGETATGTGRCDVDHVAHIDDVNSDVTQSPNTEWPHQNLPWIKCMPLRRWEFRPVLYSRYLVELRKLQKKINRSEQLDSGLPSALGEGKAAKRRGAAAWRRTSKRRTLANKLC